MKRGSLVTVAMRGDYGKPRPALIVQADAFGDMDSVIFLPLTSDITTALTCRILIAPTAENGLQVESQVMADKCSTLPLGKVGPVFGHLGAFDLGRVNRALASFLGFA